ncbi:MAG: serine/threonine protein kinase, partial [Gammaproteobacteria bacterium]
MADFKTALEALAKGNLDVEVLTKQLTQLLEKTPQYANRMLSQLDEMHNQKSISDQDYARLKSQINQYRRAHASETETDSDSDSDSTVFAQEDNVAATSSTVDDATQVIDGGQAADNDGFDVTGATDMSGIDIDISAIVDPSITSATGPAETGWTDPSAQSPTMDTALLGPGSIIKQRFKLMKVLGIGGMGKVYMALDLLKDEAKDKKPHVAIKLLNEDFKDHPEAFISLQRESSRQQKLAHPNIATIYDFDRVGGPGTPVYITMELMEGMELKDFIKKTVKKQGGLPFKEAFGMIKQLVDALAYAHEKRLVHSDLKPGNAFYCNDGTVKILDFGIARAVKNPVTGEAEKTLFDPGQLGALTPAYASYEMLEGEEPDTRDDTYALGCMAYELLTGKHPFNKLPANKAKENNLKAPIVPGLKKKQNRALARSIAFERKDRSPSVEHFLHELEARYVWYKSPLTIAALLTAAIGLGGTVPVLNYYHQKEIDLVIADINTGDPQTIVERLAALDKYDNAEKGSIYDEAKDAIQNYFRNEIAKTIDTTDNNYNFFDANGILAKVEEIYPDSGFSNEQDKLVSSSKKQLLSTLYTEFAEALEDQTLLGKTQEILNIIKTRIDKENALLTDQRPGHAYLTLADESFEQGNLDNALTLINSGIKLAPEDQQLADKKIKINNAIEVVGLQGKINAVESQLVSISDYKQIQSDVVKLASLSPSDTLLSSLSTKLQTSVTTELESLLQSGSRADAVNMATEYGELLSTLELGTELTQLKLAHLTGAERSEEVNKIVSADKANIETLIAEPMLDDAKWESSLLSSVRELDSLVSEDVSIASDLNNIRESAANLYIAKASETLASKRFDAANNFIDRGERFAPDFSEIFSTRNAIAEAKATNEKKLRVDGFKTNFVVAVEADDSNKAIGILDQLKVEIPDDPYVIKEAPAMLSSSYERLASSRFESKDYVNALKFADEGLKFNPLNSSLRSSRGEYAVEANIIELTKLFSTSVAFDNNAVKDKINSITVSPGRYSEFSQSSIATLEKRISGLRNTDENAAASLAQSAAIFFPGTIFDQLKNELQLQPWPQASVASTALSSGKLTEANAIIATATTEFATHPDFIAFNESLQISLKEANGAYAVYLTEKETAGTDYNNLRASKRFLSRSQSMWTDNPAFDEEETVIDELIAANKPAAKKVIARENLDDLSVAKTEESGGAAPKEWKPIAGRPCTENLAGYGKRAKAICYDFVNSGWRGPLMVVMPTGDAFNKNFAISKYEISVGDYGKYCAISGSCTPERNKDKFDDPLTNITLEQAKAYAAWVSERTGKTYRLPTTGEWEYAANAGGKQPKKDYNCRVALGDKVIKGTGTVSIKSGLSNGWGLKNYIGNVQEWVLDDNNVTARGGAFQDAHS